MVLKLNITQARQDFLKLAETLGPEDCVQVERNSKAVLKITNIGGIENATPFAIINSVLGELSLTKKRFQAPRDLASRYKKYLYGKAKKN